MVLVGEWQPNPGSDGTVDGLSLDEWVGQALGAASSCWSNLRGAGVFQSEQCAEVLDALMAHLNEVINGVIEGTTRAVREGAKATLNEEQGSEPLLGLATTRELLRELEVRAAVGRLDPGWDLFKAMLLRMEQISAGLQAALPDQVLDSRPVDA